MQTDEIIRINRERLERWQRRLSDEHATAQVLLAVGHDHRCGWVVLCRTEDGPTDAALAELLRAAADGMAEGG